MFWFHSELFCCCYFFYPRMDDNPFQQTPSRWCSQGLNGAHGSQVIETKSSCFFTWAETALPTRDYLSMTGDYMVSRAAGWGSWVAVLTTHSLEVSGM